MSNEKLSSFRRAQRIGALAIVVLLAVPIAAHAQKRPDVLNTLPQDDDDKADRPWIDKTIPLAKRRQARELFLEGTKLINDGFFSEAETYYVKALRIYAHPGIYYNLAIAQLNLLRPIEAYENFERAMRFGAGPLGEDKLAQARNYRALLEGQLTKLEISCQVESAAVHLDGKPLFTGPGVHHTIVQAGGHEIVARRAEWVPDTRRVVAEPGKTLRIQMAPQKYDLSAIQTRRRWARWKPWVVFASGAAVTVLGAVAHKLAADDFAAFNKQFATLTCAQPTTDPIIMTCKADDLAMLNLSSRHSDAKWEQRAAWGAYITGGAAVVVGIVLVSLNLPQTYRKARPRPALDTSLSATTVPGGISVTATLHF